jgi:hypothetical protein
VKRITRAAFKLTKLTLGKDKLLWGIFAVLAISTAWTSQEIIWLFLLAGVVALLVKSFPIRVHVRSAIPLLFTVGAAGSGECRVLPPFRVFRGTQLQRHNDIQRRKL